MNMAFHTSLAGDRQTPPDARTMPPPRPSTGSRKGKPMTRPDLNQTTGRNASLLASLLIAVGFATAPVTPALAQEAGSVTDMHGAERIEMTARVRALSQRIAAAGCYARAGINPDAFNKVAADSIAEFTLLMGALEKGDATFGLAGPEEQRKVLAGIRGVNVQWEPFTAAADGWLSGSAADDGWAYVARQNLNLMHSTKYLVAEIMNAYSNPPELLQSHAFTLDIAARQQSMSQQMAKEACGIISGNSVLGNADRLANTIRLFELSLMALQNGLDAAGVIPPPNAEITAGLQNVATEWAILKDSLVQVTGPDSVDAATSVDIFARLDSIYGQFGTISDLYVKASKFGI